MLTLQKLNTRDDKIIIGYHGSAWNSVHVLMPGINQEIFIVLNAMYACT